MPRRRNPKTAEKIAKAESDFQEALQTWESNKDNVIGKSAWDKMFYLVLDCCTNIFKSKAYNIHINDLDGKALDSTIYIMSFIKDRGARPEKLSSYCYMRCIKFLYDSNTQFYEKNFILNTDYYSQYESDISDETDYDDLYIGEDDA